MLYTPPHVNAGMVPEISGEIRQVDVDAARRAHRLPEGSISTVATSTALVRMIMSALPVRALQRSDAMETNGRTRVARQRRRDDRVSGALGVARQAICLKLRPDEIADDFRVPLGGAPFVIPDLETSAVHLKGPPAKIHRDPFH
jgi:hypothetical protein